MESASRLVVGRAAGSMATASVLTRARRTAARALASMRSEVVIAVLTMALKLVAKYISGITYDSAGRLQLTPGVRGEFTADASGMEVLFSTGQRLHLPWSHVSHLEVHGPDKAEKTPAQDGMSIVELLARPRRGWCYLLVTDSAQSRIVHLLEGMTAPELRRAIETLRR